MIVAVHQPQYLPWLGYFDKLDKSDCFVFLDTVQYKMREFQNRNKIRTADGWMWLTVPVKTKGHSRQPFSEVRVDNESDWASEHRKSLKVWYAKAPYFKDYFPFFEQVFSKKWERLLDINLTIIKYIITQLHIETRLFIESEIGTTTKSTDRIIEICRKVNADRYLSGIGGRGYLEENKFEKAGIGLAYQDFPHPFYNQLFIREGHPFEPYMSVIDLLFNEGPRSIEIIRKRQNQ